MEKALLIFGKTPEPGQVKTRLAASIGDYRAVQVYRQLLYYTFDIAERTGVYVMACFPQKDQNTLDAVPYSGFYQQVAGDLGQKMSAAFEHAFALGHQKVVVIGSDCADLNSSHLEQAFEQLNHKDLVIGPAKDGGYYLLGMNKPHPYLFENIPWSTDAVLDSTMKKILDTSLTFHLLEELSDIDTLEDLKASKNPILSIND